MKILRILSRSTLWWVDGPHHDDTGHGCTHTQSSLVEPRVPGGGCSSSGRSTTAITTAIGRGTAVRGSSTATAAASISTTIGRAATVVWASVSESTATTTARASAKAAPLEGASRPATTVVSVATTASASARQLVQGRIDFL